MGSTEERIADSRGTTVYSYDSVGRLLSRTDPTGPYLASGATIEYEYADGLLSAVKTPGNTKTYTYEEGLLKTVSDSEVGTTTYFYDSDNVFRTQFPNNVLETRTYNELGRLEFVETAKVDRSSGAKTEIISTYDYELDDVGNRLEVLENSGRQVQYQYDDLHRLIREEISNDPTGNNRVITYSYDAAGNRIQKSDSVAGNTTYIYNELNQLESETTNGVTST